MRDSKINVIIEMKNLIILFFVLCAANVNAQNDEIVASAEPVKSAKTSKIAKAPAALKAISKEAVTRTVKSNIVDGFSKGNAKLLSASFPSNVDISILGKANLYSASQAEQVLNIFFDQHKVTSFKIEHEGNSGGTKYFIGTYISGDEKFRVTINVKSLKSGEKIKSITIDR